MKFVITFLCITLVATLCLAKTKEERKEQWKSWFEECQNDPATHVKKELLDKVKQGEKYDKKELAPHTKCMVMKMGFMKPNGEVDIETMRTKMSEYVEASKVEEIITKCGKTYEDSDETAIKLMGCIMRDYAKHHRGE